MPYTPIMGTLAYIINRERSEVLLIHRNKRSHDEHLGKWNGLGGKLETHEDLASGIRREIREEAGIEVTSMTMRGTISWPGFGPNGEDWFSPLFLIDGWIGDPGSSNNEGDLEWISLERILQACHPDQQLRDDAALPMWEGDRYFLPLVFDDDPRPFHGVMPYSNGQPTSWTFERW